MSIARNGEALTAKAYAAKLAGEIGEKPTTKEIDALHWWWEWPSVHAEIDRMTDAESEAVDKAVRKAIARIKQARRRRA